MSPEWCLMEDTECILLCNDASVNINASFPLWLFRSIRLLFAGKTAGYFRFSSVFLPLLFRFSPVFLTFSPAFLPFLPHFSPVPPRFSARFFLLFLSARSISCFFCMNFIFPLDKPSFRVYNQDVWENTPMGYILSHSAARSGMHPAVRAAEKSTALPTQKAAGQHKKAPPSHTKTQ